MHNFVLNCFNFFKNLLQFLKIVCLFCILMLLCYWIQNLTNADWTWLGFIKPFLDGLLDIANSIYSVSFDFFGATFEFKYLSALIILVACIYLVNLLVILTNILEGTYKSAHFACKKAEEVIFNKQLKEKITHKEKQITKYSVGIQTKLKSKFSHRELNINIDEQNKLMNEFIMQKTGVKPALYNGCYLYNFTNFDKIDTVLDVLFKVIHSNAPLDYAICIQSGENLEQLEKLIGLKNFGKVTIAADTAYRYKFNAAHRYQTSQIGIFQNGDRTLEVHEFKEIL